MIEFSITEIALFIWGAVATGYALRYKAERRMTMVLLQRTLDDPSMYISMRDSWLAEFSQRKEKTL
jgi:hypothetical protein